MEKDKRNLEILLDLHFPIIVIETHEETHAVDLLKRATLHKNRNLLLWSIAAGLHDVFGKPDYRFAAPKYSLENELSAYGDVQDPESMLEMVKANIKHHIIVLLDFHPYLATPKIVRLLKEQAQQQSSIGNTYVLISHQLAVPPELSRLSTRFDISLPNKEQLKAIVKEEADIWQMKNRDKKLEVDAKALKLLIRNMVGMTKSDARRMARNAIVDDGAITHSDVKDVMEARYRLVNQEGILSFEYDTARFSDVAGFHNLKQWLSKRENGFVTANAQAAIDIPKGILLLGVQGCGKSLAAKAVAGVWGVPLLRMDFGVLYNKYIGETEKNLREAIKTAEALEPCVLWIDEIEKGIESGGEDNGVSQRVLAGLLTWMAEKKSRVFIVATANDISALPPELIRKGRLDEIFFVDLPDAETRGVILQLHLQRRDIEAGNIDLALLAHESKGFSGAELEQVIVSSIYSVGLDKGRVNTQTLLEEIRQTRPLSRVMAEQITGLRNWAAGRTVSA
ncbi:MAG: AAA family ATPase [Gammaproteobacteria bacterium]|nr:AAA family ATPase [Gammaproteobacteria bacterium]MDH5651744.1 AAA family ATPase [Gammaproteobacteria bacterium]